MVPVHPRLRAVSTLLLTATALAFSAREVSALQTCPAPGPGVCGGANDWPAVTLPPAQAAGLTLLYDGTPSSTTQSVSRLVSEWRSAAGGFASPLQQDAGEEMPRFDVFSIRGRHALDFDGNDVLSGAAATPVGSYTKVVVFEYHQPPEIAPGLDMHLASGAAGEHALFLRWDTTIGRYRLAFSGAYAPEATAPVSTDPSFFVTEGVPTAAAVSYDAGTGVARLYQVDLRHPAGCGQPAGVGIWGFSDTEPIAVSGVSGNAGGALQVGAYDDLAPDVPGMPEEDRHFTGRIAELMVYSSAKGTEDLVDLFATYLLPRYSQLNFLPGGGFAPTFRVRDVQIPQDGQLIPREDVLVPGAGTAPVHIEGVIENFDSSVAGIELQIRKKGSGPAEYACCVFPLAPCDGTPQTFAFDFPIDAGLHDYRFRLAVVTTAGLTFPFEQRRRIVCGDVYLIVGSSHAVAADYFDEFGPGSGQYDPEDFIDNPDWIRSFGHGDPFFTIALAGNDVPFDRHWGLGNVVPEYSSGQSVETQWSHAGIGSLGTRVADLLVESQQVPVAVFQGGVGGAAICAFREFNTCLARRFFLALEQRAQRAGVAGLVRGVMWLNGTADGLVSLKTKVSPCMASIVSWGLLNGDPALYATELGLLVQEWKSSFGTDLVAPQGLEVFAVQARTDVFATNSDAIRNVTRELASDDFTVLSTIGVGGLDDTMHFRAVDASGQATGYLEIAERVAPLIRQQVYLQTPAGQFEAPDATSAMHGLVLGQILVEFDHDVTAIEPSLLGLDFRLDGDDDSYNMVSACELEPFDCGENTLEAPQFPVEILGVNGSTVTLRCSAPLCPVAHETVSYRGHVCSANPDPALLSADGSTGALTFFKLPIDGTPAPPAGD